jgi:long-chain acyl-CoA synthetase
VAGGLVELAEADAGRLAVADSVLSLTRAELNARVNRIVDALRRECGLAAGDPVALLSQNRTDYATVLGATQLGGTPPVAVNFHLTGEEVAYILENSGARALFVGPEQAEAGREAAAAAGVEHVLTLETPEFEAFVAAGRDVEPASDTHFTGTIYYTSGTTGRPKGARMGLVPEGVPVPLLIRGLQALVGGVDESTVHLVQGPLYHAGPQGAAAPVLVLGGTLQVMRAWDAADCLRRIEEHRVTRTAMVPTMFVRLLRLPDDVKAGADVASLQRVGHTASICPIDVKRSMIEWWGPVFSDTYGASEIGAVCEITSEEWLERPGSVGRPAEQFTLQILDDDGRELPQGEVGQIWITGVRGHDIEYLGEPEKTASVHRGPNQFTLGDLGYVDEDGYLFLADRRVDMVIFGGSNVYPAEVEGAMLAHPAVDDAGVFGIPSEEWGQEVKAAVQLRDGLEGSPELEAEILGWLRDRIAHYKVPRSIDFHAELPRYPTGKLYRRVLRDAYWPAP